MFTKDRFDFETYQIFVLHEYYFVCMCGVSKLLSYLVDNLHRRVLNQNDFFNYMQILFISKIFTLLSVFNNSPLRKSFRVNLCFGCGFGCEAVVIFCELIFVGESQ